MRIAMLHEGTYPYYKGGVSTWAHNLISSLKEIEFTLISLTTKPLRKPVYRPPPNIKGLLQIPLWGTELTGEHLKEISVADFIKLNAKTDEKDVKEKFLPHFKTFLKEIKVGGKDPEALGEALSEMRKFLSTHSHRKTFRSKHIWDAICEEFIEDELYSTIKTSFLIHFASVIRHVMRMFSYKYPEADLYHSSAAALCGLIGVVKKIRDGVPYIVTEHGVYFRERMLDVYPEMSIPEKILWMNMFKAVTLVNYYYADRIFPVCDFNIEWEIEFGVPKWKIEKIYNGVDIERFKPMEVEVEPGVKPIVVMTRIEKLKDVLNVIEAMGYIVKEVPEAVCEIYGPVNDEKYFGTCLRKMRGLGLEERVRFMGPTDRPELAYNRAEVVVQPSLSEGFPFTVIEAMACGKPVVATDVGGVREAIGGAGIVVPPRAPKDLAKAVTTILADDFLRRELGRKARERVLELFTYERFIEEYRRVYLEMVSEAKAAGFEG